MKKALNIAETEWKVMEVLWAANPLTIGEIRENLADTGWSASTIKTLVRRLTQKGAINLDDSGEHFLYAPAVPEAECKLQATHSFLDRIYQGSVKMLMTNLAKESDISDTEMQQLLKLVDKLEGGGEK